VHRRRVGAFAGVLLMVGPAQPAGLHADKRIVVTDGRQWDFAEDEATRPFQYQRTRLADSGIAAP
jgi:hypothetical protein